MFKFSWEMLFFESEDTEVFKADRNKPFASNEKLHSNMSVVCTYHCRGVFHEKYFLVWLLFFVDLYSQKRYIRYWTSIFMYTRYPPRWKSRRKANRWTEDSKMRETINFTQWKKKRSQYLRRETWIVLANFFYCPSCFWSNKI